MCPLCGDTRKFTGLARHFSEGIMAENAVNARYSPDAVNRG